MPHQNRVTATGDIVADAARGTLMGNRGVLHDAQGRLGRARWRHRNWVCCRLEFKARRRPIMAPGRYTELFFLDEATALAAGHRPCAECRRADYNAYRRALSGYGPPLAATEIDRLLHEARIDPQTRGQRRWEAQADELPDGVMVLAEDAPHLVLGDRVLAWSFEGYGERRKRRSGVVTVLTPSLSVAALRGGYRPDIHPSAGVPHERATAPLFHR